jgi:hypothetical protein
VIAKVFPRMKLDGYCVGVKMNVANHCLRFVAAAPTGSHFCIVSCDFDFFFY